MTREEKIKKIENQLFKLNNIFHFSEEETKIYQESTEEFDSKMLVYCCPKCNTYFTVEENQSVIICPNCQSKIKI